MAQKESFKVAIKGVEQTITCRSGMSVLGAMEAQGLARIPVGCRGGGCGVCKVRVLSGEYRTGKMAACHVTEEEKEQGFVLACRLFSESDLEISLTGKNKKVMSVEIYRESESQT